jgi:23S rRNA (pseudouridine1915-N3)-methyltransferase
MQINLLAAGTRMPSWVTEGYQEFAKRLPPECRLNLVEIALGRRSKGSDPARAIRDEGESMLDAIPKDSHVIALDVCGAQWNTEQLSLELSNWMQSGRNVALLIGGPDGLAESCSKSAHAIWSLSKLTLPHALVRILVAEQIYRAWSLLKNHPYHRAG